jgi:tryptophanyl-tRNA synthetase
MGNYFGAFRNFVDLQDEHECIYSVVDYHALTTLQDTERLEEWTGEMALDWLAAGIRPEETIIYVQSHVPQVIELYIILTMVTPLGWLTRLPTFKEKVRESPENVNHGLVGYPILMLADTALFKADWVPVGADQAPHLEVCYEIVRRFNNHFGDVLVTPYPKYTDVLKVVGIDGKAKMSKSLNNHIEIASEPDEIWQRVRKMVTDPGRYYRSDPGNPDVCNVFTLLQLFTDGSAEWVAPECRKAAIGCIDCKKMLAESIGEYFAPFRQRRAELSADPNLVWDVLDDGARRARAQSAEVLGEVKEAIGMRLPA